MQPITVTHFTDPGCPWAYSASPALATLRWRYGDQLDWRLVLIGLTERAEQYADRGYTPLRMARGYAGFRRYGMPFATAPKNHVSATSRACRAIVAARELSPALGDEALRALQLAQFRLHAPARRRRRPRGRAARHRGPRRRGGRGRIDDEDVLAAYEADRALARTAEGGPTDVQGKAAQTRRAVRYTAPSLIFRRGESELEAGGFQPAEAYDVLLANLDPTLERRAAPGDARRGPRRRALGLTTARSRRSCAAQRRARPPRGGGALIALAAAGDAVRVAAGGDALWIAGRYAEGAETVRGEGHRGAQRRRPARSLRRRRSRRACRRSRGRFARATRVIAAGAELDRDVDDPAGVGHEVRGPQDAARRQSSRDAVVGELVVRRAGDRPAPAGAGRCRGRARRPARTARGRRPGRSARLAGVDPARAERGARARAWRGSMSATISRSRRRRQQAGQAQPTWPSPTTATCGPLSDADPKARSHVASDRGLDAQGGVRARVARAAGAAGQAGDVGRGARDVVMSRAAVPTSSAVM